MANTRTRIVKVVSQGCLLLLLGAILGGALGGYGFEARTIRRARIQYPWIRQEIHGRVETMQGMTAILRLDDGSTMPLTWVDTMSGPDWNIGDHLDKPADVVFFSDTPAKGGEPRNISLFHPLEDVTGLFAFFVGCLLGGILGAVVFAVMGFVWARRTSARTHSAQENP